MLASKCKKMLTINNSDLNLYRRIFTITWPAFLELFLTSFTNMADIIMVGRLSPAAISGVGITGQPFNLMIAVFAAVNVGTTTLVAWNIGAGNKEKANHILRQTIILNIGLGLLITVLSYSFSGAIMRFMSKDAQVVEYATDYLQIVSLSIVFQAVSMGISATLRGCGQTSMPMLYNLIANILNVCMNYLLIYGNCGFPRLEVAGSAIATSLSRFIACAIAVSFLIFYRKSAVRISLKDKWAPNIADIKNILQIGLPAAGEQTVLQTGLMMFSRILAGLGVYPYAAHQIGLNLNGMGWSVSQSFCIATTTLVGQSVGAGDYDRAEHYTAVTKKLARVITAFLAVIIISLARPISSLYTNIDEVVDLSTSIFFFIALIQFVQSVQMSTSGALRGAGDTMFPLYACIIGIWGFRVGVAFLFVNIFQWGLIGAWTAFFLDQCARSFVVWARFKSGKWRDMKKTG